MSDSTLPQRRSIRIQDYDYSQNGAYFITLCTQDRVFRFGEIYNGIMSLNPPGEMVLHVWNEIAMFYPGYSVEAIQVMPNHLHGILLVMNDAHSRKNASESFDDSTSHDTLSGRTQGSAPTQILSIGSVIQRFKGLTTKHYADGVRNKGWAPFRRRLWQRNYWEHVIRNERELHAYNEYIQNNPIQWQFDEMNYSRKLG